MKCYPLSCLLIILIGCIGPGKNDFTVDLCNNYVLARCSNDVVYIHRNGVSQKGEFPRIESKVISIGWDARYILAERQNIDKAGMPIPGQYEYYIIDTNLNTMTGPLTKVAFAEMVNQLGILIKLQDVYTYKK